MDTASSPQTATARKQTETLTASESVIPPASSNSPFIITNPGGVNPYGFDECALPSLSVMPGIKSEYGWVGIYIGGSDVGCPHNLATESWIDTVISEGWFVEPIWVGPQSTCSPDEPEKISLDSNDNYQTAYSQGQTSAHHAYTALANDGFAVVDGGVPIVDDIEGFTYNSQACDAAEEAFVKGWDATLPRQLPAVYGSSDSSHISNLTGAPPPAFIWGADWNGNPDPSDLPPIPSGDWDNNQRIKQYNGNCSAGGITVDCDYEDAPIY